MIGETFPDQLIMWVRMASMLMGDIISPLNSARRNVCVDELLLGYPKYDNIFFRWDTIAVNILGDKNYEPI